MKFDQEFGKIYEIKNPVKRGKEIEKILARFIKKSGFEVFNNPKSTKPRQSDLIIRSDKYSILAEVKWRRSKIDSSDSDSLGSRLRRLPSDYVGAIFSMSDYTRNVIAEIEGDRTREILLFSPYEIVSLLNNKVKLDKLIQWKRESLRVDGIVYFYRGQEWKKSTHEIRSSKIQFRHKELLYTSIASQSGDSDILFTQSIPDTRWGSDGESSNLLRLDLGFRRFDGLESLLTLIDELFELTDKGAYSIRQTDISWFGFGVSSFLSEVKNWKKRYEINPPEHIHHSESLSYFDSFQDGWMLLNCDQRIWTDEKEEPMFFHAELLIQLPGIPLDVSSLLRFCKEINNENARFELTKYHKIFSVKLKRPIKLKVISEILTSSESSDEGDSVNGLIVKNPFYKKEKLPKEFYASTDITLRDILKVEYLVCSLKDWYESGDKMDAFDLFDFEVMQAGGVKIFRLSCTWRNIVKRGRVKDISPKVIADRILMGHKRSKKVWDEINKTKK